MVSQLGFTQERGSEREDEEGRTHFHVQVMFADEIFHLVRELASRLPTLVSHGIHALQVVPQTARAPSESVHGASLAWN